jgi:adenylate cyclase class IV
MKSIVEIEQRYKIDNAKAAVSLLAQHGADLKDEQHIIDKWFIPQNIHTRAQHDLWFDRDHGVAYRIRYVTLPDGLSNILLDSKQHTEANNHNTFKEDTLIFDDEAAMLRFLGDKEYYNWLTIDKKRQRFHSPRPDLAISMDSIAGIKDAIGIDTVLELEYTDQALSVINDFASMLGLSPGSQFPKSLTVEAMRVLAQFK